MKRKIFLKKGNEILLDDILNTFSNKLPILLVRNEQEESLYWKEEDGKDSIEINSAARFRFEGTVNEMDKTERVIEEIISERKMKETQESFWYIYQYDNASQFMIADIYKNILQYSESIQNEMDW